MFSRIARFHYWLIFGLFIRLLIIPLASHPDIRGHYLAPYYIVYKNSLFTFYDYISKLPREDQIVKLYGDDLFIYAPSTYLVLSAFLWLQKAYFPVELFLKLITDYSQAVISPGYWLLQYMLKLPYLFFDLACLYLIIKIVSEKQKYLSALLWALNFPLVYSAYMLGQSDIFLVFCFLLSTYFMQKDKNTSASFFLGLSATFKPFGLFLLPLVPGNKIRNIFVGLLAYLVILLPYLPSPGFRQYALLAPQTEKLLFAKIPVSGSQFISIFFTGLIFIYFKYLNNQSWKPMIAPLLLFYSVVHYHAQWFAWISPFLILLFVQYPKLRPPILILNFLNLLIILSFDYSLNFGLFGVKFELFTLVNKYFPSDTLVSIIRSALAATSLFLATSIPRSSQDQQPTTRSQF